MQRIKDWILNWLGLRKEGVKPILVVRVPNKHGLDAYRQYTAALNTSPITKEYYFLTMVGEYDEIVVEVHYDKDWKNATYEELKAQVMESVASIELKQIMEKDTLSEIKKEVKKNKPHFTRRLKKRK